MTGMSRTTLGMCPDIILCSRWLRPVGDSQLQGFWSVWGNWAAEECKDWTISLYAQKRLRSKLMSS